MANFKWQKKDKIQNTAIVILSLTTVASLGALVATNVSLETKVLKALDYQIATVADDGDVEKDGTSSLVSSLVNAEDLKIEISEKAVVSYKVHYYDEDKEWLHSTVELNVEYEAELPEGVEAKYARVEIIPNEDNYISIFEKAEYVSQVTVTVEK